MDAPAAAHLAFVALGPAEGCDSGCGVAGAARAAREAQSATKVHRIVLLILIPACVSAVTRSHSAGGAAIGTAVVGGQGLADAGFAAQARGALVTLAAGAACIGIWRGGQVKGQQWGMSTC